MSMFELHDKINAKIFGAFNVASDMLFSSKSSIKRDLKNNARYYDLHKGERCFILGTGPSLNHLTPEQTALLENEITFGVNSLYKARVADNITPKYYALMDNIYWGRSSYTFAEVSNRYRDNAPVFITDIRAKEFTFDKTRSIFLYAKNYPTKEVRYDLTRNISITMNVVGFSILAAMYMGFKEIYLLGCDYNSFCSRVSSHCYDDKSEYEKSGVNNLSFYLKYYHLTTEFHYLIAKTARKNGINIINLTDGSLLDAYPGKQISDVLNVK